MRSSDGPSRKMKIEIRISRRPSDGGQYSTPYAFEACARVRGAGDCAYGRNPRKAVANLLVSVGKRMKKRKGSFKGR